MCSIHQLIIIFNMIVLSSSLTHMQNTHTDTHPLQQALYMQNTCKSHHMLSETHESQTRVPLHTHTHHTHTHTDTRRPCMFKSMNSSSYIISRCISSIHVGMPVSWREHTVSVHVAKMCARTHTTT